MDHQSIYSKLLLLLAKGERDLGSVDPDHCIFRILSVCVLGLWFVVSFVMLCVCPSPSSLKLFFPFFFVFPRTINWSYAPQNKKKIKSKSYIILSAHSHQAVCVKKLIRKGGPCRHLYKELGSLKALSVLPFYFFARETRKTTTGETREMKRNKDVFDWFLANFSLINRRTRERETLFFCLLLTSSM